MVRKVLRSGFVVLFLATLTAAISGEVSFAGYTESYSHEMPPEKYGNVHLSRRTISSGKKEVLFTHWTHRMLYSCRVCHFELGFPMEVNEVDITMDLNRSGKFCGFCHDGKEVFGTTDNDCPKCHRGNEDFDYGDKVDRLSWLPEDPYGNRIDWSDAQENGDIDPILYLEKENYWLLDMGSPEEIEMVSENENVPPVIFPHARHSLWLHCLNCHSGNVTNGAGKVKFPDQSQYRRQFCEGCHSRIAFPMDNCARCHPGMDNDW
jgi:c(7)-type cytochrome triheme protein